MREQVPQEEYTYVRMRRNVRKTVSLNFKHYELRVKALVSVNSRGEQFEAILPLIKISTLKRWFIRDEILYELRKINGIVNADLEIEVFAVYGTERYLGEYKRYLGELFFVMRNINEYDKTEYRYQNSKAYFQQPDKSEFIPERL